MVSTPQPDISKSALLIVDMQNDFLKPGGFFLSLDRFKPLQPLIAVAVLNIRRLAQAMRAAGRPVFNIQVVLREDYADCCWPIWDLPGAKEAKLVVEETWGAQIIDELKPEPGDFVITKKGYAAFQNTPLDAILRNLGVSTCIVTGFATEGCVAATYRQALEYPYLMIIVSDGCVGAENHEMYLRLMGSPLFGKAMTTDELVSVLQSLSTKGTGGQ